MSEINDIIEQVEDSNYNPEKEYELVNDPSLYKHEVEEYKAKVPKIPVQSSPISNEQVEENKRSESYFESEVPSRCYYDDSEYENHGRVIELGDEDSEVNSIYGFDYLQENERKNRQEIEDINNEKILEVDDELKKSKIKSMQNANKIKSELKRQLKLTNLVSKVNESMPLLISLI